MQASQVHGHIISCYTKVTINSSTVVFTVTVISYASVMFFTQTLTSPYSVTLVLSRCGCQDGKLSNQGYVTALYLQQMCEMRHHVCTLLLSFFGIFPGFFFFTTPQLFTGGGWRGEDMTYDSVIGLITCPIWASFRHFTIEKCF